MAAAVQGGRTRPLLVVLGFDLKKPPNYTLLVDSHPYSYSIYGLPVVSNHQLPGVVSTPTTSLQSGADGLVLSFGYLPRIEPSIGQHVIFTSSAESAAGEPNLRIWKIANGAFLRIVYSDHTEFWIDCALKHVWAMWPDSSSLEDTLCYLLGPIFGLLLRLQGRVCLHASAIEINGEAVVFAGREGAGKSTTAAAFARLQLPVLSDDIVALHEKDGGFHVLPAYPRVNLWPSSVKLLYGSENALPLITTGWEKRFLALGQEGMPKFGDREAPVGAIYLLCGSSATTEGCIQAVSKKDALLTLIANTYATHFLDARQRAEEFALLSRLVDQVPVRTVNPRRHLVSVDALCEFIHQDFAGIDSRKSPR
jgi:hypothetical protein